MVKRKDGLWQSAITINGKVKTFYGRTQAVVRQKILAYKEAEAAGPTFEAICDAWWAEHEPTLQSNTLKGYKPAIRRAIEELGSLPVKDVTPPMIKKHIRHLATTMADKTVRTQLMIYNLVFKYACSEGLIEYNPAREVSVPAHLPKRKVTAPSSEDIARVKASVDCTFGLFAFMALYTGLRRGELLALEWADVDLEARSIRVNKSLEQVGTRPGIKSTKTVSGDRVVPILDALLPHLKPNGRLVFPAPGGGYIKNHQFEALWGAYCKESGVTATPHQFRHAFATMLFENNIAEKDAQQLLGHAQLSTTMDIYTDIREQRKMAIHRQLYGVDIS